MPGAIAGPAVGRAETAIRRAHAVVICAPTDQRPALCVQAARAGRPLLVEKPVARTATEARARGARGRAQSARRRCAALFLRELPALGRLAACCASACSAGWPRRSRPSTHPGALDGWFDGPAPGCATPAAPASAASATSPCTSSTRSPRSAATSRRGSPRSTLDRAGAGGRRRRRRRWAPGPACRSPCGRAGRRAPAASSWRVAGAAGTARPARAACSSCAAAAATPERWVGAPPDAGEALRAFARAPARAALPARRAGTGDPGAAGAGGGGAGGVRPGHRIERI